ncbi:hypothetical protein TBK1r_10220 [Stieleria magnilauensis]|uniref:Lysozyme n=1 Tax=Stieleria magnilauensis TaxID=2527963 RepID=A0ABX5XK71_9BACT|nr:hypothetical protein TBK1r_10220 [Planctomycetes bacterium TBK1r]
MTSQGLADGVCQTTVPNGNAPLVDAEGHALQRFLRINKTLQKLAVEAPHLERLVELRYFTGLTIGGNRRSPRRFSTNHEMKWGRCQSLPAAGNVRIGSISDPNCDICDEETHLRSEPPAIASRREAVAMIFSHFV